MNYAELENKLCAYVKVSDAEKLAFRANLRHLKAFGIPSGAPFIGSGKRIEYGQRELFELALSFTLKAIGIPPREHARLIKLAGTPGASKLKVERLAATLTVDLTEMRNQLDISIPRYPAALNGATSSSSTATCPATTS